MNNSRKHRKKCTHAAAELESCRTAIGFNKRSMAVVLDIAYRTYQDYAYGRRGVPPEILDRARAAVQRDRALTRRILRELDRDLSRHYPGGIPSE